VQIILNTFGTRLRREGERFLIQAGDRKVGIPAKKVETILIATGIHLSSDAIQLAILNNIDIVFLDRQGHPTGRVWQTKLGSVATIRRRQLEVAELSEGLELVRDWIGTKLRHQWSFLQELKHRRPDVRNIFEPVLAAIQNSRERVAELQGTLAISRETLMGFEGSAGRAYFDCISQLVPSTFHFQGRSRQPARDPFNAFLNYGYGILYSIVEKACICAGLDPFLGFLHTDNYGKKSLVFDLIEPFRIIVEREVVLSFTGRRVQQTFVETIPRGVALSKEGRAFLLENLQKRLEKRVSYPVQASKGKTRRIQTRDTIQYEAHSLANRLLGRKNLPRIVEMDSLWSESTSENSLLDEPLGTTNPELSMLSEEEPTKTSQEDRPC